MKDSGFWRVPLTLGAITGSKQQYSKTSTAPIRSRKLWPKIIEVADPACGIQTSYAAFRWRRLGFLAATSDQPKFHWNSIHWNSTIHWNSICDDEVRERALGSPISKMSM